MTLEELKSALADQELSTGVVGILKEKGFVVRTADDDKLFMDNYEKNILPQRVESEVESKIKSRVSEIASRVEQDFFEASGIPKTEGEKYYEYIKRGLGILKEHKGSDAEGLLKDQLKVYQEKTKELSEMLTTVEESKKTELLDFKKKMYVSEAVKNLNISYPLHITTDEAKAEYRSMIERTIIGDFQSKFVAKENGDSLAFYEGDNALLDTTTNSFLSPSAIIERNFGVFLAPKSEPKGGLGVGVQKPSNVGRLTSEQFDQYASEKGYVLGSREYGKAYSEMVAV